MGLFGLAAAVAVIAVSAVFVDYPKLWREIREEVKLPSAEGIAVENAAFAEFFVVEKKQMTVDGPHDFAAWYALGNCLRRDLVVIRDGRSPSGWRFRFHIAPALHLSSCARICSRHQACAKFARPENNSWQRPAGRGRTR